MASRKLIVEVVGDASSLERTFKRSQVATTRFGKAQEKTMVGLQRSIGGATAGVLGGAGLIAVLKSSSEAASNLAEQTSKSNVVFGDASATIQDFSRNALGLAEDQALETAAAMGALFRPLGFTETAAAQLSIQLTKLAVDLSSFSNVPVEEALTAIRSALVGEFEPARRFGIVLDAARVQQEALVLSGKKNVKALTDQEKVQARVNLIMKQSVQAQGDFARTSDSLANKQKTLAANLRDVEATIGGVVNPTLSDWIGLLNEAGTALDKLDTKLGQGGESGFGFRDGLKAATTSLPAIIDLGLDAALGRGRFESAGKKAARQFTEAMKNEAIPLMSDVGSEIGKHLVLPDPPRKPQGEGTPFLGLLQSEAEATTGLMDDLAVSLRRIAVLQQRLSRATFLPEKTELQQAINSENQRADSIRAEIRARKEAIQEARREAREAAREAARKAKEAAQEAARRRRERAERQAQRRENRQFAVLGLGPEGTDLVPGAKQLRNQLGRIGDAVKGTFLDTGKTRSLLANIRKLLSGSLGRLSEDVRRTIAQMLSDIDQQLKEHQDSGPRTKFRIVNPGDVLNGLGLTPEQERAARARLSRVGAGGTIATGSSKTAFGRPIGEPARPSRGPRRGKGIGPESVGPLTINVVLPNGKLLAQAVLPELQREARRRSATARGAGAGKGLALT